MAISKTFKLLVLTAFAASSIACGDISLPQTLGLVGDDNAISMTLNYGKPGAQTFDIDLEGGVESTITVSISILDLLFSGGLNGVMTVDDLLIAGTGFTILGNNTGTLCIVKDEANPGGGSVLIDLFGGLISFDAAFNSRIIVGNPNLRILIPDGFPFPIEVQDTAELSIADLIGMLFGNADGGGLALTQSLDQVFETELLPGLPPVPIGVVGSLTLGTVNEFPTGDLITECRDEILVP